MISAEDIPTMKGEPVLAKLEVVWDETQVNDGVEGPSPRIGYGLTLPVPPETRERSKAMSLAMYRAGYEAQGLEVPDDLEEQIEEAASKIPDRVGVGRPFVMVWN